MAVDLSCVPRADCRSCTILFLFLSRKFRLRGSVRAGDVLDLIVEDAVFAASDETQSLAMTTDTLKVKNGKIVIGE